MEKIFLKKKGLFISAFPTPDSGKSNRRQSIHVVTFSRKRKL